MPDFSKTPITNDDGVNEWLHFYDMKAPLVALGTLVTNEYVICNSSLYRHINKYNFLFKKDLDLRVQHFHSFGPNNEGGHYHYDITPDDVEYLGYFVPAEHIYRIDKPDSVQTYGKD